MIDSFANIPVLTTLILMPLLGAFLIAMIRTTDQAQQQVNARSVALWTTIATFIVSLKLWFQYDPNGQAFQFVEQHEWITSLGLTYHLGIDGISMLFIMLSTLLMPICILASWQSVKERVREYMIAFLVLESVMIAMFSALDTVLFYIFFEAILIPMFLIIGIWGGPRRIYATFKFFLYTLLGSVLMLVALIAVYLTTGTTNMVTLIENGIPLNLQYWVWWAFFASFAVKVPMWPFHTWLPDAHVEAPTAGSVILAGVLLKLGGYGFLRFSLPMAPVATEVFAPVILWLSVIAIIYTSLVALVQNDMKKMIAYSSVAHMGFVTLGIFSMTKQGLDGAMFQMLSHGVISAALFLIVGVVYDRLHTREIGRYGGIVNNMPKYATVFMLMVMASAGLPGTSGFVGEFLSLTGAYKADKLIAILGASGIVLGAAYMLRLYREVVFGQQKNADAAAMPDMTLREIWLFVPLVVLVIWMGVFPSTFLDKMGPSLDRILSAHHQTIIGSNG